MKRCISQSSPHAAATVAAATAVLLLGASMVFSAPAIAQISDAKPVVRQFPKAAMRGDMVVKNHPQIAINGVAEQLSPGARIFDKNNQLVLSGQLVNQQVLVNYLRDGGGQIHQVWLLNDEEAKEKRAGSNTTIFNFFSGSAIVNSDAPTSK